MISLGIGDPDRPTYPHIVEAMREAVADPGHPPVPLEPRTRRSSARRSRASTTSRFGVAIDPESEVIPAIGAKECIYNLCFAFLDPEDVALAADPGYPVYTGGPLLAGAEAVLMPLVPELGFVPDLEAIDEFALANARLLFLNYPNNPTGAVVPDGFFERVVELRPRSTRSSSSTTTRTRRPPTTGTSRRASLPPPARRRWGSRSSRSRRAST